MSSDTQLLEFLYDAVESERGIKLSDVSKPEALRQKLYATRKKYIPDNPDFGGLSISIVDNDVWIINRKVSDGR